MLACTSERAVVVCYPEMHWMGGIRLVGLRSVPLGVDGKTGRLLAGECNYSNCSNLDACKARTGWPGCKGLQRSLATGWVGRQSLSACQHINARWLGEVFVKCLVGCAGCGSGSGRMTGDWSSSTRWAVREDGPSFKSQKLGWAFAGTTSNVRASLAGVWCFFCCDG